MFSHIGKMKDFSVVLAGIICLMGLGCSSDWYLKEDVKGPIVMDLLTEGAAMGSAEKGEFTETGWKPGVDGTLTYDIPGLPQGMIEFDITGLSRSAKDSVFFTMYEPGGGKYADPFILKNPYRVTLALKNFQKSPDSPFDWLWTAKTFPAGTETSARYVDGLPGGGYEKVTPVGSAPIYPAETHTIRMEWKNGVAKLYLDDTLLAKHLYRPVIFIPESLRIVFGRSPGIAAFDLADVAISNVCITTPGL